jgi:hypothetical protein
MVRAISELDGFASITRGMRTNKASQRATLRAAPERIRDRVVTRHSAGGIRARWLIGR